MVEVPAFPTELLGENIPPNLATVADQLEKVKEEKEELQERLKDLNRQEDEFERILLDAMMVQGIQKFSTPTRAFSRTTEEYPSLEDWDDLRSYVLQTGHLEIFQRRLTKEALKACKDERNGEEVPGVKWFVKDKLSARRVRK